MKKKFTLSRREKILLLILAVILLGFGYFRLIHQPVRDGILEATGRQNAAETQLLIEAGKLGQMNRMEQELAELTADKGADAFDLPAYDNMQHIMVQLNAILSASREYRLTFGELQFNDQGLVSRPIQMEFTAESYEVARTIMDQLYGSSFRCRLGNISISSPNKNIGDSAVKVSMTVTFYELIPD